MPSREGIRKGIKDLLDGECVYDSVCVEVANEDNLRLALAIKIIKYLHSQGVVIKVERELPEVIIAAVNDSDNYGKREFARLLENNAGYVAVEPLIEEVSNG